MFIRMKYNALNQNQIVSLQERKPKLNVKSMHHCSKIYLEVETAPKVPNANP